MGITHLKDKNSWEAVFELLLSMNKFKKGKSVLQVGAKNKHGGVHEWQKMFSIFAKYGYTNFDVLEIWEQNLKGLNGRYLNKKILGDVRNICSLVNNEHDVIFWWHGPEHITREDFIKLQDSFNKFKDTIIVIGCPWGEFLQGEVGGNLYEKHLYHWQPEEIEELGYDVYTTNYKNRKDIIGIKYIGE